MMKMRGLIAVVALVGLMAGCQPKDDAPSDDSPPTAVGSPKPGSQGQQGNAGAGQGIAGGEARSSDDIQIHSPAAGSMAPVTGGQNLQGSSGGGVGAAAKGLAKDTAANAGKTEPPSDDSGQ